VADFSGYDSVHFAPGYVAKSEPTGVDAHPCDDTLHCNVWRYPACVSPQQAFSLDEKKPGWKKPLCKFGECMAWGGAIEKRKLGMNKKSRSGPLGLYRRAQ